MSLNKTSIEWTDYTWNPVTGCKKNCSYCYAAAMSKRFHKSFEPAFHPDRLDEPMKLKKPSKIFVCSMADLFGEWVDWRWIEKILAIVKACHQHTFQFLTKNPERYCFFEFPLNAWIGATATKHQEWITAYQALSLAKASVKFISCEPLLKRIDPWTITWRPDWLIIGACTGKEAKQPDPEWVKLLERSCNGVPIFHKDNLIGGYRKEFPKI